MTKKEDVESKTHPLTSTQGKGTPATIQRSSPKNIPVKTQQLSPSTSRSDEVKKIETTDSTSRREDPPLHFDHDDGTTPAKLEQPNGTNSDSSTKRPTPIIDNTSVNNGGDATRVKT